MIEYTLHIPLESSYISGNLNLVYESKNIIIFASENGITQRSIQISKIFNQAGFSTFIFDVSFFEKDLINTHAQFDNRLIVELLTVTQWIQQHGATEDLDLAYFGDNTGSAVVIATAAQMPPGEIKAIVTCGGRPDFADNYLELVRAPTLFIIGQNDQEYIKSTTAAFDQLRCEKKLQIIPNASHLLEDETTCKQIAILACDWFKKYMAQAKISHILPE